MKKFIVFCSVRSGSTVLEKILDKHPDVLCRHELMIKPNENTQINENFLHYHKSFDEWLSFLETKFSNVVFGFGVKYHQVNNDILMKFIDRGYRLIHLVRNNNIKHSISIEIQNHKGIIKKRTNISHSIRPVEQVKVNIDIPRTLYILKDLIENKRKYTSFLTDHGVKAATLFYENLFDSYDLMGKNQPNKKVFGKIWKFIGVEYINPSSPTYYKTVSDNLNDVISNYKELMEAISEKNLQEKFTLLKDGA